MGMHTVSYRSAMPDFTRAPVRVIRLFLAPCRTCLGNLVSLGRLADRKWSRVFHWSVWIGFTQLLEAFIYFDNISYIKHNLYRDGKKKYNL
jgi:hypothetical protein